MTGAVKDCFRSPTVRQRRVVHSTDVVSVLSLGTSKGKKMLGENWGASHLENMCAGTNVTWAFAMLCQGVKYLRILMTCGIVGAITGKVDPRSVCRGEKVNLILL